MNNYSSKSALYLGVSLIGIGVVTNKWTLEVLVSSDGRIESIQTIILIAITQFILISIGIYLVMKKPHIDLPSNKNITLTIVSTLIAIIVVEISLRIWLSNFSSDEQFLRYSLYTEIPSEKFQWSPHHYLNYYPTPDYKKGLTYHNSLGFRNKEFSPNKPENIYRIAMLGGSTTYTESVKDNKKTFPYQLERILREDYGNKNVEVINAGVAGYNSWESLINLQFRVLDINPDLVIVYHGTNDVHTRLVLPEAYKSDNSGRRKQWSLPAVPLIEHSLLLRIFSRNLGITSQVGLGSNVSSPTYFGASGGKWKSVENHAAELLNKNPPIYFRRNLINMIGITKIHSTEIVFATWAHSPNFKDYASTEVYKSGFKENNEVIKEVANNYGAHLFDFASEMPKDKKYWSDGRHVNEEGALLKAQLFARFIQGIGVLDLNNEYLKDHQSPSKIELH